eukprot:TRINITY_DN1219_c2_g1_i1.p1 TRINITY_DN1219_c2_g1~~TRINITY_DN1219_c2_g1_i1.p1  ORF type:complete len:335 (-),score=108.70 TRINITY_DN1219_c2_g1_i1:87-1091(-)
MAHPHHVVFHIPHQQSVSSSSSSSPTSTTTAPTNAKKRDKLTKSGVMRVHVSRQSQLAERHPRYIPSLMQMCMTYLAVRQTSKHPKDHTIHLAPSIKNPHMTKQKTPHPSTTSAQPGDHDDEEGRRGKKDSDKGKGKGKGKEKGKDKGKGKNKQQQQEQNNNNKKQNQNKTLAPTKQEKSPTPPPSSSSSQTTSSPSSSSSSLSSSPSPSPSSSTPTSEPPTSTSIPQQTEETPSFYNQLPPPLQYAFQRTVLEEHIRRYLIHYQGERLKAFEEGLAKQKKLMAEKDIKDEWEAQYYLNVNRHKEEDTWWFSEDGGLLLLNKVIAFAKPYTYRK